MPPRPTGPRAMSSAERQAKRREQFRQMREALERIARARTIREARAIAVEGLDRGRGDMSGDSSYKAKGDMSGDKG